MTTDAASSVSESEPMHLRDLNHARDYWRELAVFLMGIVAAGIIAYFSGVSDQKVINANMWNRVENESKEWKLQMRGIEDRMVKIESAQMALPELVADRVARAIEDRSMLREVKRKAP